MKQRTNIYLLHMVITLKNSIEVNIPKDQPSQLNIETSEAAAEERGKNYF